MAEVRLPACFSSTLPLLDLPEPGLLPLEFQLGVAVLGFAVLELPAVV
eukprot:CAMPEP_0175456322 /NCGR_PEP_ID=MMETSP0095-20121207/65480_1 /TAXON_ID=311494 /ORGANISM="Alexandrium monilatum, Strain CCMP3105" /LENGTH=47 /DNA_ID= /DNA_START= /DNA_END= /DNA_ORIENTATION=